MSSLPNQQTIQQTTLSNGITVFAFENPNTQTVVIEGGIWAGAIDESRDKAGIASLTTSMLMRGTASRSFEQIYEELESVGASLGWASGNQLTEFDAAGLAEDLPFLLQLASDTAQNPLFDPHHFEQVRAEALTGVQMRANDTRAMARLTFMETLYPNHPYGQSTSGYADSLPAITPDDLSRFHKSHYGPQNAYIVIVGGITAQDVFAQVEKAFGSWRNPDYTPPSDIKDIEKPTSLIRKHVEMADKTQSDIMLGLPGPRRSHPDFTAIRLANTILGVFGMSGRIGRNVRVKQGLAYYAYSSLSSSPGPYPWLVSTGVSPDKVEQAIASIQDEIHHIQDHPVTDEELADCKAFLTGSLPLALETNSGLASIIGDMHVYNLGFDYLLNYADTINAITKDQIQKAAQTHFEADNIAIIVAGPSQLPISNE